MKLLIKFFYLELNLAHKVSEFGFSDFIFVQLNIEHADLVFKFLNRSFLNAKFYWLCIECSFESTDLFHQLVLVLVSLALSVLMLLLEFAD